MSTDLSNRDIPQKIDPRKLANQNVRLCGFFKPEQLPRITESVIEIKAPVKTALHFFVDQQGVKTLTGHVEAEVIVTCQRCLQPMQIQLQADIALGMAWDEVAAKNIPTELDAWIVGDETADLCELVEEELLLVLPYTNYHDENECDAERFFTTGEVAETEEKPNPFQALEQWKSNK